MSAIKDIYALATAGFEHCVAAGGEVFVDGMVPEAQDAQALAFEVGRAAGVIGLIVVGGAVDFDDEAAFRAQEVDDEGAGRDLAAPFPAAEPAVSQDAPEPGLGAGLAGAEGSGAIGERGVRHWLSPSPYPLPRKRGRGAPSLHALCDRPPPEGEHLPAMDFAPSPH